MINRFAPVLFVLGILILGFGFLMLVPLSLSWLSADGAHGAYDEAVLITMHWIGGLGVVVLAVAILPMLGFGGRGMLKAQTPGPMKDAKITPRITETAKGLWVV